MNHKAQVQLTVLLLVSIEVINFFLVRRAASPDLIVAPVFDDVGPGGDDVELRRLRGVSMQKDEETRK